LAHGLELLLLLLRLLWEDILKLVQIHTLMLRLLLLLLLLMLLLLEQVNLSRLLDLLGVLIQNHAGAERVWHGAGLISKGLSV